MARLLARPTTAPPRKPPAPSQIPVVVRNATPQPGLARASVILTLGKDFKGMATRVKKPTTRPPPKPTAATRDLPSWDPRPC